MADLYAVSRMNDPYEGFELPCAIFNDMESANEFITVTLAAEEYPYREVSVFLYSGIGPAVDYSPPCVGRYKFVRNRHFRGYKKETLNNGGR